jgi:membrane-associated phospholipid phosphatase
MHTIDLSVQTYLSSIHTPALTKFFLIITNVFEIIPLVLIVLLISILIYRWYGFKNWILFVGTFGVGEVLVLFLKTIFNIDRPLYGFVVETSKSFPSGHATAVTVVFVMLTYILARNFSRFYKILFYIVAVTIVTLVSFSRLYLGVHWFSDVFGGIVLGLIVSYLSVKYFNKYSYLLKD